MNQSDKGKEEIKTQSQCQLIPKKMIEHYSYALHEQIGKGFSSKVFMGKNEKTGEVVAVKVIDMKGITNEVERSLLQQEINALKLMNSPNVLKMYDYYHTSNNTYIITEYCNQGDLESVLKKCGTIPEAEAAKILKHIINGFKEQIKKGIIHRDLKPANIFLRNGIPKIADFGFSKMINAPKEKVYYNVGTPLYMSPQTIMSNKYSEKSDMWSIGVVYYELLYGEVPWQAPSEKQLVDIIQHQAPYFNPKMNVSEESKDFLRRSLNTDEEARIGIKEIEQHSLFLRRNTIMITKPRALLSNTYNTQNLSTSVDKSPNRSMQSQPKPITNSPERRTVYARQSENTTNELMRPQNIQRMDIEVPKILDQPHQHRTNKSIQLGKTLAQGVPLNSPSSLVPQKVIENKVKSTILHIAMKVDILPNSRSAADHQNNETLQSQLNICKFLFRIVQIIDHYSFFQTPALKEKIIFLIMKNIMIKMQKLKDMVEKGLNPLKLDNFAAFLETGGLSKLSQNIMENYRKYSDYFNKIWDQISSNPQIREELISDKKFEVIFDKQFLEYQSYYLEIQRTLRYAIRELNHILRIWMEVVGDNEELSIENQAVLILLDYLVVYFVMAKVILDTLENPYEFERTTRMELLADGRPGRIKKLNFIEVRQRIYDLKI